MNGILPHAAQRAAERFIEAGLDPTEIDRIIGTAAAFALKCSGGESVALRLAVLHGMVGQAWSDRSNGDCIVAIIRNRCVTTFMFRRSTQPYNPAAFNVDRAVIL